MNRYTGIHSRKAWMRWPAALLLSAFVAVFAPTPALADPRGSGGPPEPLTPERIEARRVQLALDMAAWLPRLAGRFQIEGIIDYNGETNEDDRAAARREGAREPG
jgi:hypothetical protein